MFRAWRTDVVMKMKTPCYGSQKMTITPSMKAPKDITEVMKVFELRVSSGEMSGLSINLKAYEFVGDAEKNLPQSSSKPMANAWHLPN